MRQAMEAADVSGQARRTDSRVMHEIRRLTFLVHPYCYARSLTRPEHVPQVQWRACQEYEVGVAPRWYEAIQGMDEQEAVVHHPGYESEEEGALVAFARSRLGRRLLTARGLDIRKPDEPVLAALAALAREITEAFRVRGKYTWFAHDLRIAAFSYDYARKILAGLAEQGLCFNPSGLALRAFGLSFEGCVTTWTTMVPVYMDVPSRVEIPYEMTVPDSPWLLECRHVRRVRMDHDTALYLFIDPRGCPYAVYKRERVSLADPSYYARLRLDPGAVSVLSMRGEQVFGAAAGLSQAVPPSLVRLEQSSIKVMIATARGRGGEGPPFLPREAHLYIFGKGLPAESFFKAAEEAEIVPEEPGS